MTSGHDSATSRTEASPRASRSDRPRRCRDRTRKPRADAHRSRVGPTIAAVAVLTVVTACVSPGSEPPGTPSSSPVDPDAAKVTPEESGPPPGDRPGAASASGLSSAVAAEVAKVAAARSGQDTAGDNGPSAPSQPGADPPAAVASPVARLTRRGDRLYLDGKPFRYVGLNAYGLNGQETGRPYSRSRRHQRVELVSGQEAALRTWGEHPQRRPGDDAPAQVPPTLTPVAWSGVQRRH